MYDVKFRQTTISLAQKEKLGFRMSNGWRYSHWGLKYREAARSENVLSDMYVARRLKSACLRICAVWSVFIVFRKKLCIIGYPKCAQWRFWSDCANAQADQKVRWAHMSEGTFSAVLAQRLICMVLLLYYSYGCPWRHDIPSFYMIEIILICPENFRSMQAENYRSIISKECIRRNIPQA